MKICFIGFGHMAQAIAQSLFDNSSYQLYAAAPSLPKGKNANDIITHHDNVVIIEDADIIFLAVKPNQMKELLEEIKDKIPKKAVIISIAAGLSLAWLEKHLQKRQSIVRCMPNTPIAVGMGATALIANAYVSDKQHQCITQLFQSTGIGVWVKHESDLDCLTALSGSGPAYVFLFLNTLIKAAIELGLPEATARTFAIQTIAGSVHLVQDHDNIEMLLQKVMSSGGTTAAAIAKLQHGEFEQTLHEAVQAAYQRTKELGA